MKRSLSPESILSIEKRLFEAAERSGLRYPGEAATRQPIHTVYGGAHLFKSDTSIKLGKLALVSFEKYGSDPELFARLLDIPSEFAETVHTRIKRKLAVEAVEDLRIDFEDGYGIRSDDDEDTHANDAAIEAANGFANGTLPPFFGIRIKPLSQEMQARSLRTLDLFLTTLSAETSGSLPANFVVTLPKIVSPIQVEVLAGTLDELETILMLAPASIKIEVMVETTRSIVDHDGTVMLPGLIDAARGRLRGAHFGAYDYTASCGITAPHQDMLHPACDFARSVMQASFAETGVWLSDGATNIMPIGPHRGDDLGDKQFDKNQEVVHRAWRQHYDHCRNSLKNGFYQGWDLHPAQLPSRYAALYAFFLEGLEMSSKRLRNFLDRATQASLLGDLFDDAATGQGLLNYFLRAIKCGAITEDEALSHTGLTMEEIRAGSFLTIMNSRR